MGKPSHKTKYSYKNQKKSQKGSKNSLNVYGNLFYFVLAFSKKTLWLNGMIGMNSGLE